MRLLNISYPLIMYFNIVPNFGLLPTIIMLERKILPPAHTARMVKINIPITPIIGCHIGISTGVDWRTSISIGVKGGKREAQVAKLLMGFCIIGIIKNIGRSIGSIAGV